MAHLTPDLLGFVLRWLPSPPARVLDVGCGDGVLTRHLAERGYQTLGLDPDAPNEPGFGRGTLEELDPLAAFDAAVAIRCAILAGELKPAGLRLVVERPL